MRFVSNCGNGHARSPSRQASGHWDMFVDFCATVTGPLVADAYLAAVALEHGCELVTTGNDFARFKGLRWRHPLSA